MDRVHSLEDVKTGLKEQLRKEQSRRVYGILELEETCNQILALDEAERASLQRSLDDHVAQLADMRSANSELQDQVSNGVEQILGLQQQVADLTDDRDTTAVALDTSEARVGSLARSLETCFNLFRAQKAKVAALSTSLAASEQDRKRAEVHTYSVVESLEFSTIEHRFHSEYCERQSAEDKTLIKDLNSRLSKQKKDNKCLDARLSLVSHGFATTEARKKVFEHQLDNALNRLWAEQTKSEALRKALKVADHVEQDLMNDVNSQKEANECLTARLSLASHGFATTEARKKILEHQLDNALDRLLAEQIKSEALQKALKVSDHVEQDLFDDLGNLGRAYAAEQVARREAETQLEVERRNRQTGLDSLRLQSHSQRPNPRCFADISNSPMFVEGSSKVRLRSGTPALRDTELDFDLPGSLSDGSFRILTTSISLDSVTMPAPNTPALHYSTTFSRSPSASPSLMTPGSIVRRRRRNKPNIIGEGGNGDLALSGGTFEGFVAKRRVIG